MPRGILFEVTPLKNGVPVTINMTRWGAESNATQVDDKQWLPIITQRHQSSMVIASSGQLTAPTTSWGGLTVALTPDFGNEEVSSYQWVGQQGRIWVGDEDQPFSTWTLKFTGTVGSIERQNNKATIQLLGPEADLTSNLLSLSYAGTGGVEGTPDMMGTLKPCAFGTCLTVAPVQIDTVNLVYQVHGYGPVISFPHIYEYAQSLDAAKNLGDAASYDDLIAMTLKPGEWATCTAQGLFRLGAQPKNKISADVVASAGTVAEVGRQILKAGGVADARIGDFSPFASKPFCLYATEEVSVLDAARDTFLQGGGYLFADGAGVWQVGDYFATKPPIALREDMSSTPIVRSIRELPSATPVWKVRVGFDKCWSVHSESDVSPALSAISDQQLADAAAVEKAIEDAALAVAEVATAKARIAAYDSDGTLTPSEKLDVIRRLQDIQAEYSGLANQGSKFNITDKKDAYVTAYNNLISYANSLPFLYDTEKDTPVDPTTDESIWDIFYSARADLRVALTGGAATWTNITGPGKPDDNADVTGNNTSKDTAAVAGVPASTVAGAIKDSSGNVVGVQALKDATAAAQSEAAGARADAAQVRTDLVPTITAAKAEGTTARQEAAQVRTDLVPTITAAKAEGTTARQEAAQVRTDLVPTITAAKAEGMQARTDLASEVARAQGAEGTLSTRITTAQQTADGASTAITTETTQRTQADQALANRATTLESKTGSNGAINANPTFTSYTNAASAPDGWAYDNQFNGGATRVAGENGGYALQTIAAANTNCYSGQQLPTPIRAGTWWVIEADVQLNAGTFAGAGVLFRSGTDFLVSFSTDMDTTQTVVGAGTVGQTYRFRKLIQTTTAVTTPVLYAMTHYSSFGALSATSTVTWYRCAVRPASSAEVLAQKADTTLNAPSTGIVARMGTEETTRANADSAIANRTTTLESTVNNGTTGLAATYSRIANEETTRSNADTALSNRVGSIESTVNTPTTGLSARMTTEETTRANADTALANRASALESTVNNGTTGVAATNARIANEETTRANADTAISNRTSNLESTVNNGSTGLAATTARIGNEETTRANADTALANRAYTLETRAGNSSGTTTANPFFAAWPDGSTYPSQWQLWNPGTYTREASSFTNGGYMVGHVVPGTGDSGLSTNFYASAGYWVLEASVWCSAGNFQGAGIYVDNLPSVNFATTPDNNGTIEAGTTGVRNWSLIVQATDSRYVNLYAMGNWSAFGTTTAKTIHWLRASVRPATDGEIKAMKADATLNNPGGIVARMGTEETTRASADTALANRTSSLESTINTPSTGLSARMTAEETTRANGDTALANRTSSLESNFTKLTANPNLLGPLNDWTGIAAYYSNAVWGPLIAWSGNAADIEQVFAVSPRVTLQAITTYTLSCDLQGAGGATVYSNMDVVCYDASGNIVLDGPNTNSITNQDFSDSRAVGAIAVSFTTPANTSYGVVRLVANGRNVSPAYIGARKIKLELGNAATIYNDGAAIPTINASLKTEATTRASADTAISNRTSTLESTVNNGSTGLAATTARIANEETTRANADTALANRAYTLETRAGNSAGTLTANPYFAAWPDGSTYPSQWQLWAPGTFTREASSFTNGGYMTGHVVPGTADSGLSTNFYVAAGYYVLEASVWCSAGSFQGAGIYVDDLPAVNFSTNADNAGVTGAGTNGVRHWSVLVQATASRFSNLYAMGNWSSFGTTTAKTIHWLRASVRPATDGEIKAMKADATLNNPGGIVARMGTEETTRANADTALANRTSSLESTVNSGSSGNSALVSRISNEETTRSNADTALSNRTGSLESAINTPTTGLAARMSTEETTRANAVAAVASRTNTLETRAGNSTNYTSANPTFSAWPDGAAFPAQWSTWQGGTVSRENVSFTSGAYAAYQNVGATSDQGLCTQFYVTPGYWVYEASVWCSTGTFAGAGCYVDNLPGLNFMTAPDINGVVGAGGTGIRSWSFMAQSSYTGQVNLYAMGNWASFGAQSAKVIHWLKCGVRPATDGEVKALKADATLNNAGGIVARMGTEETTRANADSALANRATTLESNFTKLNAAPNLLGPLNDWTGPGSFVTNGVWGPTFQWGGQAGDYEQLFAQSPRIYLAGNATYTLSCDLLAVGGATVYANMDVIGYDSNNNLVLDSQNTNSLTNGDFSDARGIGAIAVTFNTPSNFAYGYVRLLGNGRNVARADIGCRKVKLERSPTATVYSDNMAVTVVNASLKDEATTRSNADGALANRATSLESNYSSVRSDLNNWNNDRFNQTNQVNARVANEETARANADGALASRTSSLESTVNNTVSRVSTSEAAISNLNGRAAAYWQVQAIAGNGRAQITVHADQNGGGGVDLVGDVTFSGNLNIGADSGGNRTKITNQNYQVFDGNGVRRVALGLGF